MLPIFNQAIQFLTQSFFEVYIRFVLLHVIFHWVKIHSENPISLSLARITLPLLRPIRRSIPNVGGLDIASIALLIGLSMLKLYMVFWLQTGIIPCFQGLATLAFSSLLKQLIDIFFYTLIALVLMSWFSPLAAGPAVEIIFKICEPLLKIAQLIVPHVSYVDLSPLVISISLRLLMILIVNPLNQIGMQLIQKNL